MDRNTCTALVSEETFALAQEKLLYINSMDLAELLSQVFYKDWCIVVSVVMHSIEVLHGHQCVRFTTIVAWVPMLIVMLEKQSAIKNPSARIYLINWFGMKSFVC